MPLLRANSVIVYLDKDVFDEVARQAGLMDVSKSHVCRNLISEALAWRKWEQNAEKGRRRPGERRRPPRPKRDASG